MPVTQKAPQSLKRTDDWLGIEEIVHHVLNPGSAKRALYSMGKILQHYASLEVWKLLFELCTLVAKRTASINEEWLFSWPVRSLSGNGVLYTSSHERPDSLRLNVMYLLKCPKSSGCSDIHSNMVLSVLNAS